MISSIFGKKPDAKEVLKEETRNLKRNEREIEREKLALEREEKKLIAEIKKAAQGGQNAAAQTLAKQLIRTRTAQARMGAMKGQIQGVATQMKLNHSQAKMVGSLAAASDVMGKMNDAVDTKGLMQTMAQFERENMKMNMTQESMDEALDDLFDDDDCEEEADAVTQQVLEEIGIDLAANMPRARAGGGMRKQEETSAEDDRDDLAAHSQQQQ